MEVVSLLLIIIGGLLLLLGRNIYWIFVGLNGFAFGLLIGATGISNQDQSVKLLVGLVIGIVCAVLAIYLQKPMAALSVFVSGGILAVLASSGGMLTTWTNLSGRALNQLSSPTGLFSLNEQERLVFLIGGLVCAVIVWVTYEWALIVITSLLGAAVASWGLGMLLPTYVTEYGLLLIIVLMVIGIAAQAQALRTR